MHPTAMTFQNANASTVYTFFRGGDFQKAADANGNIGDLGSNSPWKTSYTTTLTLANTFLGRVIFRNPPGGNRTGTQTITVNGGVLEIDDGGALPATNLNTPNVTLAGG